MGLDELPSELLGLLALRCPGQSTNVQYLHFELQATFGKQPPVLLDQRQGLVDVARP